MTTKFPFRVIPPGTFRELERIERGRFRTAHYISGPIALYTDDEIICHYGGDARFGDRVSRYGDRAWVYAWSD